MKKVNPLPDKIVDLRFNHKITIFESIEPNLIMISPKYFLCILIFVFSCGSATKTTEPSIDENTTKEINEIVFVVFKMQKGNPKNLIEMVSTTKSNGKIKADIASAVDAKNSLTIEIYQQNKMIKSMTVEHPLHKYVEYPDDNNQYQSQLVEPDENEFFIRFQKKPGTATIKVIENLKNNKTDLRTFTL